MAEDIDSSANETPAVNPDSASTIVPQSPKKRKHSPEPSYSEEDNSELEEGRASSAEPDQPTTTSEPPLPEEEPPPLPNEEPPSESQEPEDDGWEPIWDDMNQAFYFYNRFTQVTQWENPRVPSATAPTNHDRIDSKPAKKPRAELRTTADEEVHPAVAGGYNPAIHGSYDPNASYAQLATATEEDDAPTALEGVAPGTEDYAATGQFNRFTGRFQNPDLQPTNFNDENKARRQMNAFFDVDAAANSHDGRSLKAERAGRRLTKSEVKQFKERRRERKEEKRRAWLRD